MLPKYKIALMCFFVMNYSEAQDISATYPVGDGVARVIDWQFTCTDNGPYIFFLRDEHGSVVESEPTLSHPINGECTTSFFDTKTTLRISSGYHESGKHYSWKVLNNSSGISSAWTDFKTLPPLNLSFSNSEAFPFYPSSSSWRKVGGSLINGNAKINTTLVSKIDWSSLPQWKEKNISLAGYAGFYITTNFTINCQTAICVFGILFSVDPSPCVRAPNQPCTPREWQELRFNSQESTMEVIQFDRINPPENIVRRTSINPDIFHKPVKVQVLRSGDFFRVDINDRQALCIPRPLHVFGSQVQTGMHWMTDEDDEDMSTVSIDYYAVGLSPKLRGCLYPMPPL